MIRSSGASSRSVRAALHPDCQHRPPGTQTFRPTLRCASWPRHAALAIFALFAWSTHTPWSEAKVRSCSGSFWDAASSPRSTALVAAAFGRSAAIRQLSARHIAIVCGHERTCAPARSCGRSRTPIRLIGVFHDLSDRSARARSGRPLDELLTYARERRIDEIFLALPARRASHLGARRASAHLPVDLKLCPDGVGYVQALVVRERLAGVPVATIRRQPIRDWGRVLKRAMDLGASAPAPSARVAYGRAGARDPPGVARPRPVRQRRLGFNQGEFDMLKFRTMRHDPGAPLIQARPDDERVTGIGAGCAAPASTSCRS